MTQVFYDISSKLYSQAQAANQAQGGQPGAQSQPENDAQNGNVVHDADYKVENNDNDKKQK